MHARLVNETEASLDTMLARSVLTQREEAPTATFRLGRLDGSIRLEQGSLWVTLSLGSQGGIALRMPSFSPDAKCVLLPGENASLVSVQCSGSAGTCVLEVRRDPFGLEQLRATLRFCPRSDLRFDHIPRDLVPFDWTGDPVGTQGTIEAMQRKLNTGLVYFSLDKPGLGKVLYWQNLTALNPYFNATGSKPENVVGGSWPELGYRPPVNPETGCAVLPAGEDMVLYDTVLVVRGYPQNDEADSAWQFIDMVGTAYNWLEQPQPKFRDWPERARRTIKDLAEAPEARINHYGQDWFHPYTASEYPDVMVQLTIASALNDWQLWSGERQPLLDEIVGGLEKFYDPDLQGLRRYLPNVGKDKNANAVDSWYYYHPLLNLANLAVTGNDTAKDLFLRSVDYGIRSARHFKYKWPIIYDMRDFSVITAVAEADQMGQTDVGGIYAWVMLQAFELTHEARFLEEAIAAIDSAKGMRFELNYQANLTAWGAAACIRLWRITNRKEYLTQSYLYLASFFHNAQIWESDIGLSRHWSNFLGVTCLQDAPYMACYECFDAYAAFERYLDYGGPDLIPAVRRLVGDYCRHALNRAWYYYPDTLPPEGLADETRNGYILRDLSFPVEDLYPDGQKAGQVGQEIYGSGAAMVFATRSFHRIEGAPFLLHTNVFARAIHQMDANTISVRLDGDEQTEARIMLIPTGAEPFSARLLLSSGEIRELGSGSAPIECCIPACTHFVLSWNGAG